MRPPYLLLLALALLPACMSAKSESVAAGGRGAAEMAPRAGFVAGDQAAPSGLRAGDTDDNARFGEYQDYLARYRGDAVLAVDVSERVFVHVLDRRERPVLAASVEIESAGEVVARARTGADGRTGFFPSALAERDPRGAFSVRARHGALEARASFVRGAVADWALVLPGDVDPPAPPSVELAFCLDATGSMGDEIARVQATLRDVARRISRLPARPTVRWGLVAYRDQGDEYVYRRWKMTTDTDAFVANLAEVSAGGGGDYREALNEGLYRVVRDLDWDDDRAVRLVFLVADAPPQLDRQDETPYTESIRLARELGIKLYPIAASGLDPAGEYVMRQLAQQTLARFLFITYGGQTPHSVTGFAENDLDTLIVSTVERELASLGKPRATLTQEPRQ